jgi:hypothetical protein
MTRTLAHRRRFATALALVLAAPLAVPGEARADTPIQFECLDLFTTAGGLPGLVAVDLPSASHPDTVRVVYDFGRGTEAIGSDFRFYYWTPTGLFSIPRATVATAFKLKGQFEVPATAGQHRFQIQIAYDVNRNGFSTLYQCHTQLDIAPYSAPTVVGDQKRKVNRAIVNQPSPKVSPTAKATIVATSTTPPDTTPTPQARPTEEPSPSTTTGVPTEAQGVGAITIPKTAVPTSIKSKKSAQARRPVRKTTAKR